MRQRRATSRKPAKTQHGSTRKPKRNKLPTAARPASSTLADLQQQVSALTGELAETSFEKCFWMKGPNPCSGDVGGTGAQGSGPGELVLERFGDVDRQLRRVRESHHASRGGSGFVRYCDSQNHAAQLQSYIHREHDRR